MPFNFSPFGQSGAPLNQIRRPQYPNRLFGQGLDPYQPNQLQPAPTPQDQQPPVNFADEYAKAASNRPNRMAYQQAIDEGAPQIQRGKWAKLGALLAAGGTSLGQNSAAAGMNLGLSAYQEPQLRSDERYKQRVAGLGQLANMEDSDVQDKLKALEMQRSDWYKSQENTRQNKQEVREGKVSDAQVAEATQRLKDMQTDKWTDPSTGIYWEKGPDGTATPFEKRALTTQEKASAAGLEAGAKADAESPARMKELEFQRGTTLQSDELRNKGALAVSQEGTDRAKSVQGMKNTQAAENLAAKLEKAASGLKPGDKNKQAMLDIAAESRKDPTLSEEGLLVKDKIGMPDVAPDNWYDSSATTAAKNKLRKIISDAYGKAASGNQTPTLNKGPNNIPDTTAPKTQANGLVRMIDPNGEEFDAKPEDVEHYKSLKAKVK